MLLLAVIATALITYKATRLKQARIEKHQSNIKLNSEIEESKSQPAIDDYDKKVIKCLVDKDGDWEYAEEIAKITNLPVLIVERSLNKLVKCEFVSDYMSIGHGTVYKLKEKGTYFALEQKILTVK